MPAHTRLHPQPVVRDLYESDTAFRPTPPRPWLDRAACVDVAISVFYPEEGADLMQALLICGSCPVRAECLDYAVTTRERHGVWGGTTPEQRRTLGLRRPVMVEGGGVEAREEAS